MRTADNLWNLCQSGEISRSEWDYQRKVVYKGVSYTDSEMKAISYRRSLVDDSFGLGKTIAAELNVSIVVGKAVKVRKNEEVEFYVRIKTKNNGDTPWYKFGKFYIQEASRKADVWTFICYDALILLQREKFTTDTATVSSALNMIASEIGVGIDSRTNIVNDITLDKLKKYTMIEVLGYIASLNYGNIYLTEENNLRLVVPSITGTARAVINDHNTKAISHGAIMDFNKVVLSVSKNSEDDEFVSGTGKNKLEVINPWGSQSLADNIYEIVSRFEMNPKDTASSEVDIMLELGDLVVIDEDPIQVMSMDYSPRMYLSITSPSDTDKVSKTKSSPSKVNPDPTDPELEDLKDKIEKTEEILDLKKCKLIKPGHKDINESMKTYRHDDENRTCDCFILSKDISDVIISNDGTYPPLPIRAKGGLGYTNHSSEYLGGAFLNTLGLLDISGLEFKNSESVNELLKGRDLMCYKGYDSEFDFSSMKDMSNMFEEAKFDKTTFNVNYKNTGNVENASSCFKSVKNLKKINFRNSDFYKLNNTNRMFAGSLLEEVNFAPDSKFLSMNDAGRMFYNCKNLTYVGGTNVKFIFNTIEYNPGVSYARLDYAFDGCENLEKLDIELSTGSPVISFSITSAFRNCKKLKSIKLDKLESIIPAEGIWGTDALRLSNAFNGCLELEELTLPTIINMSEETSLGGIINFSRNASININRAFKDTPKLKGIIDLSQGIIDSTNSVTEFAVNCGAEGFIINKSTAYGDTNGTTNEYTNVYKAMINPENNPNHIPIIIA